MQKMPGLSPASQNGGPGTNVSWRRSSERLQLRMNVSRLRMNVSWRRSMPNVSRPGLEQGVLSSRKHHELRLKDFYGLKGHLSTGVCLSRI